MRRTLPAVALAALVLAGCPPLAPRSAPAGEFPLRDGERVTFLGDSITHYGLYIAYIQAYLATRFPDRSVELIDLGLSSETASGNTEADHPYPRPDIHERLDRALKLSKPDLVVICYGMNDGIYSPPDPKRFDDYRKGIESVVKAARDAGAEVIVGTPPTFDPVPVRARLKPAGAPAAEYGYKHPFEGYDDVLKGYAEWLDSKRADGWTVVDLHRPMLEFARSVREANPDFTLAKDGVHPEPFGHWLMARAYLDAWGAPAVVDEATIDFAAATGSASTGKVERVARDGDGLRLSWSTRLPMPRDPRWDPKLVERSRFDESTNRHRLAVANLPRLRYALFEGDTKLGEATRDELSAGLDLTRFAGLSTNRRSADLLPLALARHFTLQPAWLQTVGHGPPVMPKAPTLEEARDKAAKIEAKIRELARPVPVELRIVPL